MTDTKKVITGENRFSAALHIMHVQWKYMKNSGEIVDYKRQTQSDNYTRYSRMLKDEGWNTSISRHSITSLPGSSRQSDTLVTTKWREEPESADVGASERSLHIIGETQWRTEDASATAGGVRCD